MRERLGSRDHSFLQGISIAYFSFPLSSLLASLSKPIVGEGQWGWNILETMFTLSYSLPLKYSACMHA
jgi:hypothetical protein